MKSGWIGAAFLAAALALGGGARAHDDRPDFASAMPPDVAPPEPASGPFIDIGRGPIPVVVPTDYDPKIPTPLIILLHGYTSSGASVEAWMRFTPRADKP